MRLLFALAVIGVAVATGFVGHSAPATTGPGWTAYELRSTASDALIDLHHVNWRAATLPGRVCGADHPIHLRDRKAYVRSSRWRNLRRVEVAVGWSPVAYGDLDGDRLDEAALGASCSNGGGTADGVLAYAQVVYHAGTHAPVAIAVLRPHWQPKRVLPTLLTVALGGGRLIGHEAFYGPRDGTCCPSGRAQTVWIYRRGTLRFAGSRITRRARP